MEHSAEEILILGIGNILLGDEGAGVHAVRAMEALPRPDSVHVMDGGTGGFHLLSVFQQYRKMILIDAALDGNKPGTVRVVKPKYAADFPQTLSAHDIGLRDLVNSAALLGFLPEVTLVIVSISDNQPMSMELSQPVAAALPEMLSTVKRLTGIA